MVNKDGGLDIGGKKYKVEFVIYDSQGSQATGVAAVNRLIFEDKVKFIEAPFDPMADTFIPITEANKVIFLSECISPVILNPNNHYSFAPGPIACYAVAVPALFTKRFPDFKNYRIIAPDSPMGHMASDSTTGIHRYFGIDIKQEFYPASSTDLSSIGTKVKDANPEVCIPMGGGPILDSICLKAIAASGWQGVFYQPSPTTAMQLGTLLNVDVLKRFYNCGVAMEFDPPLNEEAKVFKGLYEAKYGKWQGDFLADSYWECLKAALQQAGSLDTDKIAAVIGNGLNFAGVDGNFIMVSRPDMGNERTVAAVYEVTLKQIVDGKPVLVDKMPLAEIAQKYGSFYKSLAK
jgi:branched-chain amino acid transport system substrate-binding protein